MKIYMNISIWIAGIYAAPLVYSIFTMSIYPPIMVDIGASFLSNTSPEFNFEELIDGENQQIAILFWAYLFHASSIFFPLASWARIKYEYAKDEEIDIINELSESIDYIYRHIESTESKSKRYLLAAAESVGWFALGALMFSFSSVTFYEYYLIINTYN